MALSGNQITGMGAIGFPGMAYSGFIAKLPISPLLTTGVLAIISGNGIGITGTISESGLGVSAVIAQSSGVLAIIDGHGIGATATISGFGKGVEGKL